MKWLDLPAQAICLESGQTSGHKVVVIHGCTEAEINRRIDAFFD